MFCFFFLKQKTAYEMLRSLVGSEMCIRDSMARELLEDYVLIERDRQKFREYYLARFRHVLPEKKVVRYYQLENKIEAAITYDLAARIPLSLIHI